MDEVSKKKIVFLVTEDWYFCSHRLELAVACIKNNYDVYVITQANKHAEKIISKKINLVPIIFPRSFRKFWLDLYSFISIYNAYSRIKPDIVHHVALKPVLYGSLVCLFQINKKPSVIVNAVTGLGSLFISKDLSLSILRTISQRLLAFLLRRPNSHLIVQNKDDEIIFREEYLVDNEKLFLIRGSGVNIEQYKPKKNIKVPNVITVMLVARILKDKGVEEFIESIRILKKYKLAARYILVGRLDLDNPSGIVLEKVERWQDEGIIEWWNECVDMPKVYHQANIVVLPSYREGFPKVLLEAGACGLPVIATDVPGCREIVNDGVNGLLVPVKNSNALADAIVKLIKKPSLRNKLGKNARKMVEAKFASEIVIEQTLKVYNKSLDMVKDQ